LNKLKKQGLQNFLNNALNVEYVYLILIGLERLFKQ